VRVSPAETTYRKYKQKLLNTFEHLFTFHCWRKRRGSGCEERGWCHLAWDRDQWQAAVTELQVPWRYEAFLGYLSDMEPAPLSEVRNVGGANAGRAIY
jgi:hypothetical protein